jgi:hypothetical protein
MLSCVNKRTKQQQELWFEKKKQQQEVKAPSKLAAPQEKYIYGSVPSLLG